MSVGSKKIAFGGVITALGTVIIILSGIFQMAMFILPAVSGLLVLFSAFEVDYRFSMKIYFSISILSLILSPDKSSAILFITFLGYYPLVKVKIEEIMKKFKITKILLKLLLFNLVMFMYYFILVYVLATPRESFEIFGVYLPMVFLIVGNITFLMYDRCIVYIFLIFVYKVRSKIAFKIIE